MNPNHFNTRYQRQTILPGFGNEAQQKIANARVLVIGAGGLGCPSLQYLTAAGVGTLGIADNDVVSVTNLHRQILFAESDLSKPKASTAAAKLSALNSEVVFTVYNETINKTNAFEIIENYDVVLDCTDNFESRYLINDACVLLGKPLVFAAVLKFEGQLAIFNLKTQQENQSVNYRDLFPNPIDAAHSVSCNEAGVLGVLPGIMGLMQATETLKIITGIGEVLENKLGVFDALKNSFLTFNISKNPEAYKTTPQSKEAFLNFNYALFCNLLLASEISPKTLMKMISNQVSVIDIRNLEEEPKVQELQVQKIPISQLEKLFQSNQFQKDVVLICQTGKRSLKAVEELKNSNTSHNFYSLKGGVLAWNEFKNNANEHPQKEKSIY